MSLRWHLQLEKIYTLYDTNSVCVGIFLGATAAMAIKRPDAQIQTENEQTLGGQFCTHPSSRAPGNKIRCALSNLRELLVSMSLPHTSMPVPHDRTGSANGTEDAPVLLIFFEKVLPLLRNQVGTKSTRLAICQSGRVGRLYRSSVSCGSA